MSDSKDCIVILLCPLEIEKYIGILMFDFSGKNFPSSIVLETLYLEFLPCFFPKHFSNYQNLILLTELK